MREALGLARAGARELKTGRDGARKHLHEGDPAVLLVVQHLEDKAHRAVIALVDVEVVTVDERHAAKVGGTGEVRLDVVHEARDALLARAGAGKHGNEDALGNGLGEKPLELVLRKLAVTLEVLEHELIVCLNHKLAEMGVGLIGGAAHVVRDVADNGLARTVEATRLHADDIDDALEVVAHAPRQRHGAKAHAKALLQRRKRGVIVGFRAVDAVHEDGTGQGQVLGRIPQARGDGAGIAGSVNDKDCSLHGRHRGIGVTDEVRVAGGIDNVETGALPRHGGHGELDGEGALLLLGVVVERGLRALVATKPVRDAREMEHGLGKHGLAHATLADEGNVPDLLAHDDSLR